MKLLLTSPDAIQDKEGHFFDGIEEALDHWIELEEGNAVVVVSIHKESLDSIPEDYHPLYIKGEYRGSPRLVEVIKDHFKLDPPDIIILAGNHKDMQTAANSKLILLNAEYAKANNPDDIIYSRQYGIPIANAESLINFFNHFVALKTPWYYRLEVDENTTIYSLTNANTYYVGDDVKQINERFKGCLKSGDNTYQKEFMIYFLMSCYHIFKEFENVKYWGIYPSSSTADNDDLGYFVTKARQSYGNRNQNPLLIRTKAVSKRHDKLKDARLIEGCDSQFDSIIINPWFKKQNRLKDACVCIIDDFTTYGTSCETVRSLFLKAGASKVLFITMGKYGKEYHKYDYSLEGDIFGNYTYKKAGKRTSLTGEFNAQSNKALIESLRDIL